MPNPPPSLLDTRTPPPAALGQELGLYFLHPGTGGPFVPFRSGTVTFGRDPGAPVTLTGRAVSWHHAELSFAHGRAVLRDLSSTNGTFVNGAETGDAALEAGDVVRMGDHVGVVISTSMATANPAPFARADEVGVYSGPVLGTALAAAREAAAGMVPVVIQGETGAGKELVARLLHAESGRPGPLLMSGSGGGLGPDGLDPAGPRLLGEAEMFSLAAGGTLVLDEVTGLPIDVQTAIAARLAAGVPARLILTTQEPMDVAHAEGRLSPALREYLRANAAVTVLLPPLRQRVLEIPALFRRLYAEHGDGRMPELSAGFVERLCIYDWPFNVREMVLLARRVRALHADEIKLRSAHLPARMLAEAPEKATKPVMAVPRVDLPSLLEALRAANGNVAQAADRLGISRQRAYRLMEGLDLRGRAD